MGYYWQPCSHGRAKTSANWICQSSLVREFRSRWNLPSRQIWLNLYVVDSKQKKCVGAQTWEYFQAKKAQNRFGVPQGTKFYRVKCKPVSFSWHPHSNNCLKRWWKDGSCFKDASLQKLWQAIRKIHTERYVRRFFVPETERWCDNWWMMIK